MPRTYQGFVFQNGLSFFQILAVILELVICCEAVLKFFQKLLLLSFNFLGFPLLISVFLVHRGQR